VVERSVEDDLGEEVGRDGRRSRRLLEQNSLDRISHGRSSTRAHSLLEDYTVAESRGAWEVGSRILSAPVAGAFVRRGALYLASHLNRRRRWTTKIRLGKIARRVLPALSWDHLVESGWSVGHLSDLVHPVRAGGSIRHPGGSAAFRKSKAEEVHACSGRLRKAGKKDQYL